MAASWAEAEGEAEFAAVIRASGDTFESSVLAALEGTACAGSVKFGAAAVGAAGCVVVPVIGCIGGAIVGAVLGGVVNPACHRTVGHAKDAIASAMEGFQAANDYLDDDNGPGAATATSSYRSQCSGKSFATDDGSDCAIACAEQAPTGTW